FLYCKDRLFFEHVVRSHIRNKAEKGMIDWWLLGNLDECRKKLRNTGPQGWGTLNCAEKILAAQSTGGDGAKAVGRGIKDRYKMAEMDPGVAARRVPTKDKIFRIVLVDTAMVNDINIDEEPIMEKLTRSFSGGRVNIGDASI